MFFKFLFDRVKPAIHLLICYALEARILQLTREHIMNIRMSFDKAVEPVGANWLELNVGRVLT